MSIHSRIAAIQMRMQQIQSKFGNTAPLSSTPLSPIDRGKLSSPPMEVSAFDKLLQAKMQGTGVAQAGLIDSASSNRDIAFGGVASNLTGSGKFDEIIKEASRNYGVEEKFIKAIIQQESGFNAQARSGVGALGLMQLMPETAKELGVNNPLDPKENIMGGVKYIKQQLDRFGGDKQKALAAYNAGPGAVMKYGGIPPYAETQNYVKNIMSIYNSLEN